MNTKTAAPEKAGDTPAEHVTATPGALVIAETFAEALATRTEPTGVKAAVEAIRGALDPEAHVMWRTSGPRNSHVDEIAAVLVNIGDARRIMVVQAFTAGTWKLYAELQGRTGPDQLKILADTADQ